MGERDCQKRFSLVKFRKDGMKRRQSPVCLKKSIWKSGVFCAAKGAEKVAYTAEKTEKDPAAFGNGRRAAGAGRFRSVERGGKDLPARSGRMRQGKLLLGNAHGYSGYGSGLGHAAKPYHGDRRRTEGYVLPAGRAGGRLGTGRRGHGRVAGRACAGNAGKWLELCGVLFQLLSRQQAEIMEPAGQRVYPHGTTGGEGGSAGIRHRDRQADSAAVPVP